MAFASRRLVAALVGAAAIAGAAWQAPAAETASLAQLSHIHGVAVDPAAPDHLLLATHHGLWRVAPDGAAVALSENRDDFMGFAPHPTNADVMMASGHPASGGNLGFIRSDDGGRTWRQASSGAGGPVDFHAMDVSPADPDVIYGLYGRVQVSRDGGETWRVAGAPNADMFDLAVSAKSADTVYAATREGLTISRDGGVSWGPASLDRRPASMVEVAPNGTAYAFIVGMGLVRTAEPALNWVRVDGGLGERILLHLAIDPTDADRLYAVAQTGEVLVSDDGGRSWRSFGG